MHSGIYIDIPTASSSVRIKKDTTRVQESEIKYDELIFHEQVGTGGRGLFIDLSHSPAFGVVFKGQWRHQWVAISIPMF